MTSSSDRPPGPAPSPLPGERLFVERRARPRPEATQAVPPREGYARFIPREEMPKYASWTPGSFGGEAPAAAPAEPAPPTPAEIAQQIAAARQAGYADGYRDGLVALDGFKQSYAQQVTQQVGQVAQRYAERLGALEKQIADHVAEIAIALARQVVRDEVKARPQLVAAVAQEALAAVLDSAQRVTLRLHPEDHALVAQHAAEAVSAHGARLAADASLSRGDVLVDSDVGAIDATLATRWRRAVAAMGRAGELAELNGDQA
ncbi:flagellar assembly protein FliH [Caldimonas sp. KR1-144]|uniref:flagellar assembly protein FliH n=1 Tax=Caldimonas sp. KR1-144 TaxID=3400911 RepID=UPI003C0C0778